MNTRQSDNPNRERCGYIAWMMFVTGCARSYKRCCSVLCLAYEGSPFCARVFTWVCVCECVYLMFMQYILCCVLMTIVRFVNWWVCISSYYNHKCLCRLACVESQMHYTTLLIHKHTHTHSHTSKRLGAHALHNLYYYYYAGQRA